jgi:hypothetical protein
MGERKQLRHERVGGGFRTREALDMVGGCDILR